MRTLHQLAAAAALLLGMGVASAQTYTPGTVTFDDLTSGQQVATVAANYMGFTWGAGYGTYDILGANTVSMYTTFGASGTSISRAKGFIFDGADFFLRGGADTRNIYISLYDLQGKAVYDSHTADFGQNQVSIGSVQHIGAVTSVDSNGVASFYSGLVSRVAFAWDGNSQNAARNANDFGMDNFKFRAAPVTASAISTSPVPEPQSYAMLLAGLGLMGAIAKRRRA